MTSDTLQATSPDSRPAGCSPALPTPTDVARDAGIRQAHRFAEILNGGDVAAFDTLVAPGYVNHNAFAPPGPDGVKAVFATMLAALSDFRVVVEDAIAAGDRVVGRYTYTGVHTGPLFGYAPTGGPVTMRSIDVWRVGPDGRFVEHWDELNTLEFFQQIGGAQMAPPTAAPTGARADGGRTDV